MEFHGEGLEACRYACAVHVPHEDEDTDVEQSQMSNVGWPKLKTKDQHCSQLLKLQKFKGTLGSPAVHVWNDILSAMLLISTCRHLNYLFKLNLSLRKRVEIRMLLRIQVMA